MSEFLNYRENGIKCQHYTKQEIKRKLKQQMDENKSILPMMMFFGVMDMMMFSMMFGMMGMAMSDYVPAENMPEGGDTGMDDSGGGFDDDVMADSIWILGSSGQFILLTKTRHS